MGDLLQARIRDRRASEVEIHNAGGRTGGEAILAARLVRFHAEHVLEPGWLPRRRQPSR